VLHSKAKTPQIIYEPIKLSPINLHLNYLLQNLLKYPTHFSNSPTIIIKGSIITTLIPDYPSKVAEVQSFILSFFKKSYFFSYKKNLYTFFYIF
jgi:hypothetical protein